MAQLLEIKNLQVEYNQRRLFAPLHFCIQAGQIMQIGGQNGAGKTSLLKVLAGLKRARRGSFYWQGHPIKHAWLYLQQYSYYLGHELAIKPSLTVIENLHYFAALYQTQHKLPEILKALSLEPLSLSLVATLSNGQQRRAALAKLLLVNKPLWLLDEPFVALDQANISILVKLFINFINKGGTIIFTSHQQIDFPSLNITHCHLEN